MRDGFRVFDSNRHVIEPADLFERALEAGSRPVVLEADEGMTTLAHGMQAGSVAVAGHPVTRPGLDFLSAPVYREHFADAVAAGFSASASLADMDREGVDAALLFPTAGMYATWSDHIGGALSATLCQAYNRWLHDYCAAAPQRLKGVALLPLQDIAAAIRELHRAVEEDGHVAILMRPNPLLHRYLHDAVYDPIYAEAESLGVPIIVKEMMGSVLPTMGADRYANSLYEAKAVADPFEIMLAFLSFFGNNVVERFPGLKVGFVGAGAGWLPYWLERHEEHWGSNFGMDCPSPLPADWLFPKQGFIALDPWESTAPDLAEDVGEHCIVWGSHYPLPEALTTFPNGADRVLKDDRLSKDAKAQVLWDNAARLFGLT